MSQYINVPELKFVGQGADKSGCYTRQPALLTHYLNVSDDLL